MKKLIIGGVLLVGAGIAAWAYIQSEQKKRTAVGGNGAKTTNGGLILRSTDPLQVFTGGQRT